MARVLFDVEVDWAARHHLAGFIVRWDEPLDPRSEAAVCARITELLAEGWVPPTAFPRPRADGPRPPLLSHG